MKMKGGVNMKEKNSWIVWLIALIAVVALIVAIVALGKISTTGEGIFEWFKKESTTSKAGADVTTNQNNINRGLLGNAFVSLGGDVNSLKGYEVKYDENGSLVYEITNLQSGTDISFLEAIESGGETDVDIRVCSPVPHTCKCGEGFKDCTTNKCIRNPDGDLNWDCRCCNSASA